MNTAANPDEALVLSYLGLRKAVGVIGIALPLMLAVGKILLGRPGILGSKRERLEQHAVGNAQQAAASIGIQAAIFAMNFIMEFLNMLLLFLLGFLTLLINFFIAVLELILHFAQSVVGLAR